MSYYGPYEFTKELTERRLELRPRFLKDDPENVTSWTMITTNILLQEDATVQNDQSSILQPQIQSAMDYYDELGCSEMTSQHYIEASHNFPRQSNQYLSRGSTIRAFKRKTKILNRSFSNDKIEELCDFEINFEIKPFTHRLIHRKQHSFNHPQNEITRFINKKISIRRKSCTCSECGNYRQFIKHSLNLSLAANFERIQRILQFKKQKKENLQNLFFNLPKQVAQRASLLKKDPSQKEIPLALPLIAKKESQKDIMKFRSSSSRDSEYLSQRKTTTTRGWDSKLRNKNIKVKMMNPSQYHKIREKKFEESRLYTINTARKLPQKSKRQVIEDIYCQKPAGQNQDYYKL